VLTRLLVVSVVAGALPVSTAPPSWTLQMSGVTARLRGVSASSENVVWASGADGTVIRTEDGGVTWRRHVIPDTDKLDFRDIDAVDDRTAYVLSIGPGEASRIYKSSDAGKSWTLQFRNEDPKAFYDAMAFRDGRRGFAFADSVDGSFVVLQTNDGGRTWGRVPVAALPPALPGEGAYAASGTNIAVRGELVWIATTAARVLRSADGGRSWTVSRTTLATGPSAGIFSIAFRDDLHGVVVGGDFKKEAEAIDNAAITDAGGGSWTAVAGLSGYRSAAAYVPALNRTLVAVGPSGADVSADDGRRWTPLAGPGFHAIAFAPKSRVGWAVGENGAIGRIRM
jgi:photosystem II stability/assembly factor-like uncharacterized protein